MGLLIGILALLAVFTLGMGAMALLLPLILWRNREPRGKPAATADQPVDSGMSPSTDEAAPDFYAFAGPRPDGRQSRPRQRVVGARATGSSRRLTGTDSSTNSSW